MYSAVHLMYACFYRCVSFVCLVCFFLEGSFVNTFSIVLLDDSPILQTRVFPLYITTATTSKYQSRMTPNPNFYPSSECFIILLPRMRHVPPIHQSRHLFFFLLRCCFRVVVFFPPFFFNNMEREVVKLKRIQAYRIL